MRRARGFTLIELLVSIGLFGLIATGAMSLVVSGNKLQANSARVDVAQTAVRATLDFIGRDVVSTSTGAASGVMYRGGALQLPIVVTDGGTAGPDVLDLWMADATGLSMVMQPVSTGSTQVVAGPSAPAGLAVGSWFLVTDLSAATIYQATAVGSTVVGGVTYGTLGMAAAGTFPPLVPSYPPQSYVFPLRHVTYSVSTSQYGAGTAGTQDESLLLMDLNRGAGPQPLAEGVEDFQVALWIDNNQDGVINEVGAAANDDELVFNVAGETMPASLTNLRAIRITVVGKTTVAFGGAQFPARPKVEDHPAAPATDGFPRRITTSLFTVRNYNL